MGQHRQYAAFISYAHADEAAARRIHIGLETYRLPKGMDVSARNKLTPIFRDVTELTAHHSLSEKIRDAVKTSRFLIVLCSPAAKKSHWVNEEIKLFRKLHGEGSILAVIVDGTPYTAFPPALTEGGREPLAANMTSREGFRFGITQLAASMLGVGLDRLVQRDSKRRRTRLQLITAGALAFATVMGGMAWTAVDAREEAETSRSEAEKMVEYLITDLKGELDAVGRLSILDDVGVRVTDYYDAIPLSDMDDDRLARQARARHILGEVAVKQGRLDHATTELDAAYAATEELLRRKPDDPDAIFAHAQSEYWVGKVFLERKEPEKALPSRLAYSELAKQLNAIDPNNRDYVFEYGWAENNLGYLQSQLSDYNSAIKHYEASLKIFEDELGNTPDDAELIVEVSASRISLATSELKRGRDKEAKQHLLRVIDGLSDVLSRSPDNKIYFYRLTSAKLWLQEIQIPQKECHVSQIKEVAKGTRRLIDTDPTNLRWSVDYIQLIRIATEHCAEYLTQDWLDSEIDYAILAFNRVNAKDKKPVRNIAWLETYRSK